MNPIDLSKFEKGPLEKGRAEHGPGVPATTDAAAPAGAAPPIEMSAPAPPSSPSPPGRCDSRKKKRNISLPVLGAEDAHHVGGHASKIARSRVGKWRAGVLVGVHVLIAAHILLWLVVGMTVSPVEPSEAMYALESGLLNAGFIFFLLAIVSTLVFGRFFCGWGCHVVALQDLCSWAMTKMRVRPKPFRSRLLMYVPLGLALYMFVWPTFKREVVRPLSGSDWEYVQRYIGETADFPGWSNDLVVRDFWKTFAPWYIAIPFLGICGFGVVYFLGSKGFCTYGCPYGGFFTPIDRLAPGKIRVTDACEGCGHCTAVCTSNVRVHEEVRDYGMVVDPGCMKCLDCVSVCPNDALYFGLGKPAILAKPRDDEAKARRSRMKKVYDLTGRQEVLVAAAFLLLAYGFRGMLNQVPLLMAVGMGSIGAFSLWKLLSLLREPHVRLQSLQLKYRGRVKPAGWVFAVLAAAFIAAGAWGAAVKYHMWRAQLIEWDVRVPQELAFVPGFVAEPEHREAAEAAIGHYMLAGPPGEGGYGWALNPAALIRLAYLNMVVGDAANAEAHLRLALERGRPRDDLVFGLAMIMAGRGADKAEIEGMYREVLAQHPELPQVRARLTQSELQAGRPEAALALHETALADKWLAWTARTYIDASTAALSAGKAERAVELARLGVKHAHGATAAADRAEAAMALARAGEAAEAEALLRERIERSRPTPQTVFALITVMSTGGKGAEVIPTLKGILEKYPELHEVRLELAGAALGEGRAADAVALFESALKLPQFQRDARLRVDAGTALLRAGRTDRAVQLLEQAVPLARGGDSEMVLRTAGAQLFAAGKADRGFAVLREAAERFDHSAGALSDLAQVYAHTGKLDEAIAAAARAAELSPYDANIADFLSQLHAAKGNAAEAQHWRARTQTLVGIMQRSATLLPQ